MIVFSPEMFCVPQAVLGLGFPVGAEGLIGVALSGDSQLRQYNQDKNRRTRALSSAFEIKNKNKKTLYIYIYEEFRFEYI